MSYFSEPLFSVLCQRFFYTPFAPLELASMLVWYFYTPFVPLELAEIQGVRIRRITTISSKIKRDGTKDK
ncbi:hypothetical protein JT359_09665 [Candidatus Poribacteria bacterium]|nr:hypothetical protein [Candidatus Poribacteria bacterium]